ncbi:MAG: TolC family protein [Rhodothermales bacterium]|nr:TolC family protein [Rhodothermales bacterium]
MLNRVLRPLICSLAVAVFLAMTPAGAGARQPAGDTLSVSVTEAILRALAASPEIGDVASQRDFAEARYDLARASRFLTDFRLTTGHSLAPGLKGIGDTPTDALYLNPDVRNDWSNLSPYYQIQAEVLQPLYTWGELSGNINAARHGIAVEEASVDIRRSEVALRTGELYYSLLLTDELYRLTDRAGAIVEQAKREIRRLLDEGAEDVDDADLFQVELTEQEFMRRVVEVTQRRETARTALKRQLFLPDGTVVLPDTTVLDPIDYAPEELAVYFDQAFAHRPEMAKARAGLAAREALVGVARSHYYPKLFAGLSTNLSGAEGRFRQPTPYVGDPFRGRSVRAGLGLRQNLNVFQTHARVEQAEAERNQVRYQQEGLEQLVLFQVEEAYRNLVIARAALDAQTQSLSIAKNWLQAELVSFDLDLGDTENLVKAVQAELQIEAQYYETVQRYNVAVLRLLHAAGMLLTQADGGTLVD